MTSPGPVTRDLLATFDDVRSRTLARLEGLTDAEYLWEPVASCMTLRAAADGVFRADPRPPHDAHPAPFTTIAWRIWHIGADCLRGYGRFFDDEPQGGDRLRQPMGPRAGAYSHESYLLLALHALDETAHHGAELGVLRDLYLAAGAPFQRPLSR